MKKLKDLRIGDCLYHDCSYFFISEKLTRKEVKDRVLTYHGCVFEVGSSKLALSPDLRVSQSEDCVKRYLEEIAGVEYMQLPDPVDVAKAFMEHTFIFKSFEERFWLRTFSHNRMLASVEPQGFICESSLTAELAVIKMVYDLNKIKDWHPSMKEIGVV